MSSRLPNLIVIGAMKSGTTSLHDYLAQHPDIFMSKIKEINFFLKERHYHRGIEWYQKHFNSNYPICGESSQNYSKRHEFEAGVAKRIHDMVPNTRIIYIVRDPIKRIVSHHHEALEGGYAPKEGLNQYLSRDLESNHYVLTSSYNYQIQPYVEVFPEEQILIITLEELQSNRLATMNKIFRFVGVSECNDDSLFNFVRNTILEKRRKNFLGEFIYGPSSQIIRNLLPRELKDRVKASSFSRQITTTPVIREELSESTFKMLVNVLEPDISSFRKFTGISFAEWSV